MHNLDTLTFPGMINGLLVGASIFLVEQWTNTAGN